MMDLNWIYEIVTVEWGDSRTSDFPLVNSPLPAITILCCYAYLVLVYGPKFMKNRSPFNIDWIISIYNCIQILWNAVILCMCLMVLKEGIAINYDWWCIPLFSESETLDFLFCYGTAFYFYNKIFDLMDTIFFVLRKKFNQVSGLHLFHHILMVTGGWIVVKFHPGGNAFSLGFFNVIVHIVMYSYYQLTLMKWNTQKWKKHLTQMQILQFVLLVCHNIVIFFRNPCNQSIYIALLVVTQGLVMTYLFSKFYINAYTLTKRKSDKAESSELETDHRRKKVQQEKNALNKNE